MTETHHAPARDNKLERIASCSDAQWLELEARAKMLRSVAELPPRSRRRSIATQEAALLLGASLASTYRWLSRYDGQVEDLLPAPPGQPRGRLRLAAPVQAAIDRGIHKYHLSKQKFPLSETVRRIQADCNRLGLPPPSRKAIQTRLDSFDQREVARCRGELLRAEKLSVRSGSYDVRSPMAVWQIDHTTMDVMVVSSIEGVAIGRPYLTLIVDVATRMIAGFYISLDPPSSRNVAAALLQGVSPKDEVLKSLGIAGNWPLQGIPDALHTDNASEFAKAAGYRRGCANYHIELVLRDVGKPRDGGHIERLIGTMMGRVHFLPGTTFSNPKQRERYKSEAKARLTIDELQQWFAKEVLDYHERRHSMLPGLSETYLGTHDANVILRDVAVSKLSTPEVLGLIDAGLANMASQSTPLWRWVAREDKDFHYLKALAIWGDDDAVRIGALKVLAWGKVSLEPSSFIPDRMGESGTQLRDAIYEYLSRQDDAESLLLLQAEFQKADYKNEVALVTALLRRLSRQSSDVPIRFLALENATPPYGRRTPDWAELSHFTDDELRTAFRHRDADVRAEAAIQLGRRDLLSSDEKLALRNDPSASLRAAGVQIAIEDGETLALADAERIIVRRTKNALMQSPEGARQYEQVRRRLLETFTSEDLLREAEALYEPAEDAYEILLRREWKARAEVARGEVKGGFRTHFDDILARRRAVLGDAAAALALPANMGLIYEYRASCMIRAALNVIGEKGGKADLFLFRHALTTPYFNMVESDFLFFGKYGEWSDILAIARASRSRGSLLNRDYVVPVEAVAATIVRIATGRERELVALELPDDVRVAVLKRLPKAAFARLPDDLLVTLLNLKADAVRRIVAIRCARDLTKARCEKLLGLCYAQGAYFYNVVHWLDLAVSMARPVVEQVATSQLLDD